MVHIPYLQPFVDVNKRVSRLGANIPLICFIDVPERAYVQGTLGMYEGFDVVINAHLWQH